MELAPVLCDNLQEWVVGLGGGRGVQREETCVYLWLIYVVKAETSTTL